MSHSQHFLCHSDLVQSTGVLFSLMGPFVSPGVSDLLVVYAQRLDVYRLETAVAATDAVVLHLLHSFPLAGVAESASLVYVKKKTCPCLALTFAAAKLVLVRFDAETASLVTMSLHNFEEDGMGLGTALQGDRIGRTQFQGLASVPIAKADPDNRCMGLLLYSDQVVLLPLDDNAATAHVIDDDDEDDETNYEDPSLKLEDRARAEQYASTLATFGLNTVAGRAFILRLKEIGIHGKVIDMAFLDGYLEPTLMVLHEESDKQATVGRYAMGYNTCSLTVLSINLATGMHPKIWSIMQLPSDASAVTACPAPLGGAVITTQNAFLYFNQNQYFGLSTNSIADSIMDTTKLPLHRSLLLPDESLLLTNARLSPFHAIDEMLVSLANGKLYVLSLPSHKSLRQTGYYGNAVCQMMLRPLCDETFTTCTSLAVDSTSQMIFLGTRDGNSQLLTYTNDVLQAPAADASSLQPEVEAAPVPVPDDLDSDGEEIYLYGRLLDAPSSAADASASKESMAASLAKAFPSYTVRIVDELASIGQVTAMDMGLDLEEDDETTTVPRDELVLGGGFLHRSSLSVVHRGIRPVVTTEAELDGCRMLWTIYGRPDATDGHDPTAHKYVVLSLKNKTMVLKTGDEMEPIEDEASCGMYLEGPTLAMANLLSHRRIVQVFKLGIRLLEETADGVLECTQEIPLDADLDCGGLGVDDTIVVVAVDVLDPYLVLLLSDGSIRLVAADPSDMDLTVVHPEVHRSSAESNVTALCLFHDWSQVFAPRAATVTPSESVDMEDDDDDTIDRLVAEEEELEEIYNVSASHTASTHVEAATYAAQPMLSEASATKPLFCAVCDDSGTLNIYALPDFELVASYPGLHLAPQSLLNVVDMPNAFPPVGLTPTEATRKTALYSPIADLNIHRVGPSDARNGQLVAQMVLVVYMANGDLILYAASPDGSFAKQHAQCITRGLALKKETTAVHVKQALKLFRYPMLCRYSNVGGHSGIFFRGVSPMWIHNARGRVGLTPMAVPTSRRSAVPVLGWTEFQHWNCPTGFMYYHSDGVLRVCEWPSNANVVGHGQCVLQKVPLASTIHHVVYVPCTGAGAVQEALKTPTYAVVVSKSIVPPFEEDEKVEDVVEAEDDGYTAPKPGEVLDNLTYADYTGVMEEQYELRLIQHSAACEWKPEGVFSLPFERHETVLSVQIMYLADMPNILPADWKIKRKPYVVIGTGIVGPNGEDENGKGRLLVYEIDYAQYTNAQGVTGSKVPKLKLTYAKEHKQGAISMVKQLGIYVLAAVGSKLIVYELKNSQLVGCAFFDAQLYIVSLNVIKATYIVYGDIYKGVYFLKWSPTEKRLVLLAKDFEHLALSTADVSVLDTRLGIVAADMLSNVHTMQFAPGNIESRGGQRLLRTADFHVGARVTSMLRKRLLESKVTTYVTLLATSEGSLGVLTPVHEKTFRRLYTLQSIMINALPHNAGLNPREFRQAPHTRQTGRPDAWCSWKAKKAFLDMAVIGRFIDLDYVAQRELARCIGTTSEMVLHNLLELQRSALFL
ncbi:hypothetical protein SDRG_02417 [Saprolegnia diclina VS20]|uniref:Cleavage/polyadenylation specificity factor A subunit C-terminal domain-containing protein n=1 Tax=Saprolegnia diclina (strain VS20) TaxID=1156394 RepID=T0SCJ1_SAPDV|nr:hypothetical protein SDRG_02417 [Saprolegnia diclina VS20]EQC40527.1 hypothetical protein SDRG_02417 [Saprolegnia diclina VS20]|eukprot:XP_008606226.1 hypothetical protein SDRG_02417 [Saprolegnia diclina VS20]